MLTPQNAMKHANWGRLMPSGPVPLTASEGKKIPRILWMASPPIHTWMPNQPQATNALRSAGTFAPRVPKEARHRTGKGIP